MIFFCLFVDNCKFHVFVSNILLMCFIFLGNMLQQTVKGKERVRVAEELPTKIDSVVDVPCFVCSIQHLVSSCDCNPATCKKLEEYLYKNL